MRANDCVTTRFKAIVGRFYGSLKLVNNGNVREVSSRHLSTELPAILMAMFRGKMRRTFYFTEAYTNYGRYEATIVTDRSFGHFLLVGVKGVYEIGYLGTN